MADKSKQIIEGVVSLPVAVGFSSEVAATITNVRIGGFDLELEVSSVKAGDEDHDPVLVAPHVESVRKDINWREYLDDHWAWGSVTGWTADHSAEGVSKIAIRHFLLRQRFVRNIDPKKAATNLKTRSDALFSSIDGWTSLLMDWLEIGSGRVLHGIPSTVHEEGAILRAWGNDGSSYLTLSSSSPIVITSNIQDGLSLRVWRRALELTSSGIRIPEEYILLRDARRNMIAGEQRRAILDAATGAEIALARLLDNQLASTSKVAADLIRNKWHNISGLYEALKKFGVVLPGDIQSTGLATPRNKAIHKGRIPSKTEVQHSIDLVAQVIEMALPLATVF